MTPPIKGMKLLPVGMPLMFEAWMGCVVWAASQEEHRGVFKKETGLDLESLLKRSTLDAMIDKSSGYESHVLASFCDWVTERVWGEEIEGCLDPGFEK